MRAEFKQKIESYRATLRAADSNEKEVVRDEFNRWYDGLTDEERAEMKPYWDENKKKIKENIKEIWKLIKQIQAIDEKEQRKKRAKEAA
jgi:hypothetical protein